MKINKLSITGVGGIEKELNIDFNDKMNIICGTNGIGKTTILECIANFFVSSAVLNVKKNSKSERGKVCATFEIDNTRNAFEYEVNNFMPENNDFGNVRLSNYNKSIITLNAYRNFNYIRLNEISRDESRNTYENNDRTQNGIDAEGIKKWFCNRYMFETHEGALNEQQLYNLGLAKKSFSIIDEDIEFSRVKNDTFDIMLNTNQGEIYYEYLSSGYKSSIHILLGIIKEIEYRFKNPYIKVDDFDGIILIDEIEVHLHPQWQSRIINALRTVFKNAQIIVTTHSPNVIQTAEHNEVIALYYNQDNEICIKELNEGKYEFQGWTIEEILNHVMGMEETTSKLYKDTLRNFEIAIENDDGKKAQECYDVLSEMLHPQNYLREILKIRKVGVGDSNDKD